MAILYNHIMKRTRIYNIIKWIAFFILKMFNLVVPKSPRSLLFIPHSNCIYDNYDIINNLSDNVLKLCDSILDDSRFSDFKITILVYDVNKARLYKEYCQNKGFKGTITFITESARLSFFKSFCRSSVIFTDNYYRHFLYKIKSQKIICLGYFVLPFKDDYIKISNLKFKQELKLRKLLNRIYDYHISTSLFCSRELSVDSLLHLPKYITTGFPRNDIFFDDPTIYRNKLNSAIGFSPRTVIAFVPTHRDYEREGHFLYDDTQIYMHSLFGKITHEEEERLNEFLEKEDIVIIAKAHPIQVKSVISQTTSRRIIYFSDLITHSMISLQEILAASDMMATDYSTACYDYLLTGRPIIYYFYDYELEFKTRTFFINPIETLCAGDIVKDIDGFIDAIKANMDNPTLYINERLHMRNMIFYHKDGRSTDRVKEFILSNI